MQKKLILSLLITMLILTATFTSSQAQFYKWTDNEGIAHYSNKPPCDREFEKVSLNICEYAVTESGIPKNILSEIKKSAASKFPGDYSKQESYVKEQIEAYKRLQAL